MTLDSWPSLQTSPVARSPKAKLLMLQQWRAGLRSTRPWTSKCGTCLRPALNVQARAARQGFWPVHPELHGALLAYGDISQDRIVLTPRPHGLGEDGGREELGTIAPGKRISTCWPQLRPPPNSERYPRQLPDVDPDYAYLPRACADPTGSLAMVP